MSNNIKASWKNIPIKHWIFFSIFVLFSMYLTIEFIKPFFAERHFREGYNLTITKRYPFAIDELKEAINYSPWETHYMTQLGRTLEEMASVLSTTQQRINTYKELELLYLKMIKMDPLNPWFKNRLAIVYEKLQNHIPADARKYKVLAKKYHYLASENDKKNPLFQLNYAYYLHQNAKTLSDLNVAIPYYKAVIRMDDRMLEARFNLADIYRQYNKKNESLEQYLAIYEKNPNFREISLAIASLYIEQNKYKEALPFLEKQLKVKPNNIEILRNIAGIYFQLEKWSKAVKAYQLIFSYSPNLKPSYEKFYIQSLINAKQINLALIEMRKYLKRNPNDKIVKNELNRIETILNQ